MSGWVRDRCEAALGIEDTVALYRCRDGTPSGSAALDRKEKAPTPSSEPIDDLTPQEKRANAWSRQGWVQVWTATTTNPDGRRRRYWVRPGSDGLWRLFPGVTGPPTDYDNPHFYVNGGRVFRDEGHPEGPSPVPWYVVKAGRQERPGAGAVRAASRATGNHRRVNPIPRRQHREARPCTGLEALRAALRPPPAPTIE
jgi:hypothetical protein